MPPFQPSDPNFEDRIRRSFASQAFMEFIGAKIERIEPGFCEIHLPYKVELSQQDGFFHGGVVGTIADNAAGYASYSLMDAKESILTVEYKLNLVAPGGGDALIARGHVVKPGRTLTVARADVFAVKNGLETLCATLLTTMMALGGKSEGNLK